MARSYSSRKTADQWHALVTQWQQSDQSTKQFCHEQGLAHSSFCQWRKRLKQDSAAPAPTFIDLSSL